MIRVEIDNQSGFCAGVIRAIGKAEKFLDETGRSLYSLGAIVHNEAELSRLREKGLVTLDRDDIHEIAAARGESILIRAHGQPPSVYRKIEELGFKLIDCTCPVVLGLQKNIRKAYDRLQALPKPGRVVIFGKRGHAEVLGLIGQVDGDAVVVEDIDQLMEIIAAGALDLSAETEVFSQTTMSPIEYKALCDYLCEHSSARVCVHETICSQVATRHEELELFARRHDVIIFVSGKTSSNGKVLCELCKSVNIRTYHISNISEIQKVWFSENDFVGVCGATSTPKWLLEQTARSIEGLM